jgi:hypothetical protein
MSLLIEVGGLLLIAAVLGGVLTGRTGGPLSAGVVAIAAVTAGIAFWGGVWATGERMLDTHAQNAHLTESRANVAAGRRMRAREDFLSWVAGQIPSRARLYLECGRPTRCGGVNEWITYRLLPHLFVASPSSADYALFYETDPRRTGSAHGWKLRFFAPGFALGARP